MAGRLQPQPALPADRSRQMDKNLPAPDLLRKLLHYDSATGLLYWKKRPEEMFSSKRSCSIWNTRYAEKEAFTCLSTKGYRTGRVFAITLKAHRVIWAIVQGQWPCDQIDHIDRNRCNNKIENLRAATNSENKRNSVGSRGLTSSFRGVCKERKSNNWRAYITLNRRVMHLGTFECEIAAARAYDAAARAHHGGFANTNFAEVTP